MGNINRIQYRCCIIRIYIADEFCFHLQRAGSFCPVFKKPDIEVERTPADIAAGRDPQLEAAVGALAEEVSARRKPPPPRFNLL